MKDVIHTRFIPMDMDVHLARDCFRIHPLAYFQKKEQKQKKW